MKLNLTWRKAVGKFATGEVLSLNKLLIANYHWNAARPRDTSNDDKYVGYIDLPSLPDSLKRIKSDNPETLKAKIEDSEKLIVGIGADVAAERTVDTAIENFETNTIEYEKIRRNLQQQLEQTLSQMEASRRKIQALSQAYKEQK